MGIKKTIFILLLLTGNANADSSAIIELTSNSHRPGTALIVSKAERKLKVWTLENNIPKLAFTTDVDIGKGSGVKIKRGDMKTPEGVYFLIGEKMPPEIPANIYGDLAFITNYPNYFDRLQGKTGNGIWLHAVPDPVPLTRGSKGCVVVKNNVIKKLQSYIKLGHTALVILDNENEITERQRLELKKKVRSFVGAWKNAWETQDIEKFLGFYSSKFKGYGMNLNQWAEYKKKIATQNKGAHIEQRDFNILQFNNQFVVLFSQLFESPSFKDEGDKILYLGMDGQELKIQSEEFLKEKVGLKKKSI